MYDCVVVNKLWSQLSRWLDYICGIDMTLSGDVVILNNYKGENALLVNTLILIVKQYIYAQSCMQKPLNFIQCLAKIHRICNLEYMIAKEHNKLPKHNMKWGKYYRNVC